MPVLILSIVVMVGCRGCRERDGSFPQAGEVPAVPSVTITYPEGGDTDIPINTKISATFNTPMVETEISTATFTLTETSGSVVKGTVTLVGLIALFDPTLDLKTNTSYTATINAGIRSVAGNTLAENFTWIFTTGAISDSIRPTVVSTNPVSGAVGVPINTIVAVPFSEVMDPLTINSNTFFLTEAPAASIRAQGLFLPSSVPGGLVSGTVSYLGKTAYFKPESPLKLGTTYTAVINTGAKDVAGNTLLENYVWSFTGIVADTTAPTIASTAPAAEATGVAINTKIAVTFSEMMSIDTLTNSTFKVEGVSGTVTYDPLTKIATFKPTANLMTDKLYTATITTAATDLAGNAITANYIWRFTTGATADSTPPTVLTTVPANAATNVSPSQQITCTFSEGMESATINGTTFTVKGPGGAPVEGTVTYAGTTATFIPTGGLANSTVYNAAVTTGVKDLAGNAMAAVKTWSFTTGVAATTVTSTDPLNGATDVATNKSISATFSGTMDPATINGTTFTLQVSGGAAVAGAVSYTGTTATFNPTADLTGSTIYTATITTGAKDVTGNAIVAAKTWSFTTGAGADIVAPTVVSTNPANGDVSVETNKSVTAIFSESMDPSSIDGTTFTLKGPGGVTIAGEVTYIGKTATFNPTSDLANSTIYDASITTGAKDLAGNPIAVAKTWSFTTGAAADLTKPTITVVDPLNAATGVGINRNITANFSENMEPSTITNTTFTVRKLGGAFIDGDVTYADKTATFNPTADMANSTTYVANITIEVKDLAGNAMETAKTWSFVTGAAPDTLAPTVTSTNPLKDEIDVALNQSIKATFSESIDPDTINDQTFKVAKNSGGDAPGTVTYDALTKTATFKPTGSFVASIVYKATIASSVKDLAGNRLNGNTLAKDYEWTFETGLRTLAEPVALNAAAPFGCFGGSAGVTNEGIKTVINGDIGTTAASTLITGFRDGGGNVYTITPSNDGLVTGTIFTATAPPGSVPGEKAAAGHLAATNAFLALSPAQLPGGIDVSMYGGNPDQLGNRTLKPGIYKSAPGSFMITENPLTLDAQNDPNAVWVFQMASTLTVGGPGAAFPQSIILKNGAQAKNVFWQVSSAATINEGGGGTMVGTIIAEAGVTFSTSGNVDIVTLNGRALSLSASVTYVNTVVNVPAE